MMCIQCHSWQASLRHKGTKSCVCEELVHNHSMKVEWLGVEHASFYMNTVLQPLCLLTSIECFFSSGPELVRSLSLVLAENF